MESRDFARAWVNRQLKPQHQGRNCDPFSIYSLMESGGAGKITNFQRSMVVCTVRASNSAMHLED